MEGVVEVDRLWMGIEPSSRLDDVYVTVSECAARAALKFKFWNSSSVNVCVRVCAGEDLDRFPLGYSRGHEGVTALFSLGLRLNYSGMDPFTEVNTFFYSNCYIPSASTVKLLCWEAVATSLANAASCLTD